MTILSIAFVIPSRIKEGTSRLLIFTEFQPALLFRRSYLPIQVGQDNLADQNVVLFASLFTSTLLVRQVDGPTSRVNLEVWPYTLPAPVPGAAITSLS